MKTVVLRGGILVDGSGAARRQGDIAIRGDRIVAVGRVETVSPARVIDCTGLIVTPGFIDLHNHSDKGILEPETRP
ncbi:MAG: D-aminoacylase, partial [Planctomycetaceae bacterium]|nr:D-aminoacylase [Planctomycetaceae bacterium]